MDLLKDWKLVDTCIIFVDKRLLVHAVFEQTLQTVQFDDVVMSEELRELLILMSEGTGAAVMAVFVIVERSALGSSILFLFCLLLNRSFVLLFCRRVFVRAILAKSARTSFHPIIARFLLLFQVCLCVGKILR